MTALAVTAVACIAIGCGSTSEGGGGSGSSAATATAGSSSIGREAQRAIDAAFEGSFAPPPRSSPTPRRDQSIWYIPASATLVEPGWLGPATDALGWRLTTFDGKFSPDTTGNGLRQAIAAKADGIILFVVDCATVKASLQDVEDAGIPVVAVESIDCDEAKAGEPSLFDAVSSYEDPQKPGSSIGYTDFIRDVWGYALGLGLIDGTDGSAKIIDARETDLQATLLTDEGIRRALGDHCPGCEIVETIEFVGSDYGAKLQEKVSQALVQHPDATAVAAPGDFPFMSIAPAIQASGRKGEIWGQAGEGQPQMVNLISKGNGANGGAGLSMEWEHWAALDALNRIQNGEAVPPTGFPSGNGTQLFDKDRNMPPDGKRWQPPIDFRTAYLDAWGVN